MNKIGKNFFFFGIGAKLISLLGLLLAVSSLSLIVLSSRIYTEDSQSNIEQSTADYA